MVYLAASYFFLAAATADTVFEELGLEEASVLDLPFRDGDLE